ncbi:hypothetical protein MSAN_00963900 [Mycena sanguinolenta]|uniref:NACHT domain-containing protein n=1 Tax=Mycena sanguinolenta TaxID=230812 RepID=A0A8H7DBS9_9AGAR|nr:hypothetical protein MSAN_00963900 [Mycena sanguinolenta]
MKSIQASSEIVPPSTRLASSSVPSLRVLSRPASPQMTPAPLARESCVQIQTEWTNLKEAFKALQDGSDLYPALKVALGKVTLVMDLIEHTSDVDGELMRTAETIKGFQRIFLQYKSEKDISPAMCIALDAITSGLELIEETISSKIQHEQARPILEEPDHVRDIMIAFKGFSNMIDRLQLNMDSHVSNYNLNISGGVGGAGGMSEQGTAGSGGIGQGPNIHIQGSNVHVHAPNSTVDTQATDALKRLSCIDAASIDAQDPEGCLEGTRVELLADLQAWSCDPNSPRIFWLDGMAGTGKSAITRSFCRMLQEANRLGGSFFCMRGNADRSNPKCIIPTLAVHLASQDTAYTTALLANIKGVSPNANLQVQVERLLEQPLRSAHGNEHPNMVFVIDALDELTDEDITKDLIRRLVSVVHGLAIKLFVTSRPERHIRPHFGAETDFRRVLRLHDIEANLVKADISLYLTHHFNSIRAEQCLPTTWGSTADVEVLAGHAGKLFIYASTAIKYIHDRPRGHLQDLICIKVDTKGPLTKPLDDIYGHVLWESMKPDKHNNEEISLTKQILAAVLTLRNPLSVIALGGLLQVSAEQVREMLDQLHAVIYMPEADDEGVISTFHASFRDFLTTPGRAPNNLLIDLSAAEAHLFSNCMRVMSSELHFNVSKCPTSYFPNTSHKLTIPLLLQYIASGSADKMIQVWDAKTGKPAIEPIKGHTDQIKSVAFSPDGTCIASGSDDKTICVWDIKTGKAVIEPMEGHTDRVWSVVFSPDGTYIASGSEDYTIGVWDAKTGMAVIKPIQGHEYIILSVAFSPDGRYIASGSGDDTIRVWDFKTGKAVMKAIKGHTNWIRSVVFSSDGRCIASGSDDGTICVWDAKTGKAVMDPIHSHSGYIYSVAFSPDRSCLVSGSDAATICLWDAKIVKPEMQPIKGLKNWVRSVAFSSSGTYLGSGSTEKTIHVQDRQTGKAGIKGIKGHADSVFSVAFSPDGTHIVSGSGDQTIYVWDVKTGKTTMKAIKGHTGSIKSVAFSPDGTHIVSGSKDCTICVWDAKTGKAFMKAIRGHTGSILSIAFSPDGTHIASGSVDKTIRVWDAKTGEAVIEPIKGHTDCICSVAFSPDGTHLASGSTDRTIRVWDAKTGKAVIEPIQGHTDFVRSVAFSPDGTHLASGSDDNTIRVWDTKTGKAVIEPIQGHYHWVQSVAFSPDGTCIASGSADKTIRVWDAKTGKAVRKPFKGHTGWICSVAFSPDGNYIVSGSDDKRIRVWKVNSCEATVQEPGSLPVDLQSASLSFPHSYNNWICGPNKELIMWVPPEYQTFLQVPPQFILGGASAKVTVDLSRVVHGTNWDKCYIG